MLPFGVVIPCKNSMAFLPRHLEHMRQWLDLAGQVVVVDSFSTDGSLDYLKKNLNHPNALFLSHPPGLYKSWNFGIEHVTLPYVFISTTGDTITREGITHLMRTIEALHADVIVSKPVFLDEKGEKTSNIFWPVDDIVETRKISVPRVLTPMEVLLFVATNLDGTLLGSSASNVYSTEILKRFPFSSDFGKAGDGAWSVTHFADVVWSVTPSKVSTFLLHANFASAAELESGKNASQMDRLLMETLERLPADGRISHADLERFNVKELCKATSSWFEYKRRYDVWRKSAWPWILNPVAWRDRCRRNVFRDRSRGLRNSALSQLDH